MAIWERLDRNVNAKKYKSLYVNKKTASTLMNPKRRTID